MRTNSIERARYPFMAELVCVFAGVFTVATQAADVQQPIDPPTPEVVRFFENEVRPMLVKHCYECHSGDEANGELLLDSRAAMLAGGESGAAVIPGDPGRSVLIEAINYGALEMPPDGKLSDQEIAVLTRWVSIGAPWPGADPNTPVRKRDQFDEEDRKWWAISPIVAPVVPTLDQAFSGWARNEIDHFTGQRMAAKWLTPAPEASPLALVRRVYLDVIGLPPTPAQIDSFLSDPSAEAYESLVDRLLDSKGYGEHAARQWLDLVRYADSDGYRADGYRPDAFRYRDYVIQSFNEDKPYDRFVQEQIAGDEMFPDDLQAQVALGYLRHWVYEWNIRDARTQWKTILEDVTDTTADVFLGLGLQCAKCHNHKFDPLLQKDYFRLQAFFAPIMPQEIVIADAQAKAAYQEQLAIWEAETAELRAKIAAIEQPYRDKYRDIAIDRFPDDLKEIARKPVEAQTPLDQQLTYLVHRQVLAEYERLDSFLSPDDKEALVALRNQLKAYESQKPEPLPVAMVVSDVGANAPEVILPTRSQQRVDPGVPSIIDPSPMPANGVHSGSTTGRRSALAKWLTEPSNPLSTRVIANRVWQSHFGRGLAANPSDFGMLGGPPSHPELLDWLTTQLIQNDWSLKSLHRTILLSATYRQSTEHPSFVALRRIDPANEFYWRCDTTRLSAEEIRDALLVVSGELQECEGGPGQLADSNVRTIYTRVMRNSPDQLLDSFDLPQFFSSNSTRNTTTTPVQSLLMFNSDRLLGFARRLAESLESQSSDPATQVQIAWRRVYGRLPTTEELSQALEFLSQQRSQVAAAETEKAQALIETAKLPYRDGQAVKFDLDQESLQLIVPHSPPLDCADFTIETFFQLRSIADSGAVRTLVSKWDGKNSSPGWRFGVTGAGSRRKPQTLVLQMFGPKENGRVSEAAIFSDQHIRINTPYYASASFQLPREGQPGTVTFFLKDLSNDDEQLQVAQVSHDVVGAMLNQTPLTIGAVGGTFTQPFDGLVDDVRLSAQALSSNEILQTVDRELSTTIGYWRFEAVPGVMRNSVSDELDIVAGGTALVNQSPRQAALADFCHVLLNSNEFLYRH